MTDFTPPHSREAEEAVIGSILIDPDSFVEISQIIKASDFFIDRHRWIFKTFETLISAGQPIDLLTVTDQLDSEKKLSEIGGVAFITGLLDQVPTSLNGWAYAQIVSDKAQRRKGIRIAGEIVNRAMDTENEFNLSAQAQTMILEDRSSESQRDVLGQIYSSLYEPLTPLIFGIPDLDNRLGGMFRGELTILAGDQGTGKSALMIWAARANVKKYRVLVISLEMQEQSVYMRMTCGDLSMNWNQVRAGKINEERKAALWEKAQDLHEKYTDHLIILESASSLQSIHAAVMRYSPDLVIIDHVELIDMGNTRSGQEKIDQFNTITRYLRQKIAKPFNCHVMLLWQLNRSAFKENRRPTKHDLYMAGTKDPDSILLLYRPDLYDDEAQNTPPIKPVDLEVIIDKARNDFTGIVPIKYDLKKQAFYGLARADIEKVQNGEI